MVDELSNENTLRLKFFEFLEAFARIAHKSSLPKFTTVYNSHHQLILLEKSLGPERGTRNNGCIGQVIPTLVYQTGIRNSTNT